MELPGVPDTPEWMCPLCEVDQLSADEDLYDDSDLEELQQILFDDTLNETETDIEVCIHMMNENLVFFSCSFRFLIFL